MLRIIGSCLATIILSAQAHAAIINFGNSDIDPFLSYSQDGFTVSRTVGTAWDLTSSFSASGASLATAFNGDPSQVGDRVDLTRDGGGDFRFVSLAQRALSTIGSGSDDIRVTGLLGGLQVFQFDLNDLVTVFTTFNSPSNALINRLRLEVSVKGGSTRFVDDIEVTPDNGVIPLPASAWLLLSALGLVWCRFGDRASPT